MSERLSDEQVKKLNEQRLADVSREKAELYDERMSAARERGFYLFLTRHCGAIAVANDNVYWSCTANDQILSNHIQQQRLPVNEQTLETAFQTLKSRGILAEPPIKEYERKTDTTKSLIVAQTRHQSFERSVAEPRRLIGVSREEICKMPKERIAKLISQGFESELNRILAGK